MKYDGALRKINMLYVITIVFTSIALVDQFKYIALFISKGCANIISANVYLLTSETFP